MEASLPNRRGSLGSSPFAAPREIEHPLTPLGGFAVAKLAWVQPRLLHPAYELWGGDLVAATLRFRDLNRREALAASAESLWTIRDEPGSAALFSIRKGSDVIGSYHVGTLGDGAFVLRNDRAFTWVRRALWEQRFAFIDERGAELMQFRTGNSVSGRTTVQMTEMGAGCAEATLLAVVGKYLLLATRTSLILRE